MANKSKSSRQALTGADLKKFRRAVSELKAKGLVSKRVDARSQKPTRYMRGQVKAFSDVLEGKAKVIHTPKRSQAKEFEGALRVKGKSVVVPVTNKAERVRYNAKKNEISSSSTENGQRMRKLIRKAELDLYDIKTYPRGKNVFYRMPFAHGSYLQFDTPEELFAEMFKYETKTHNPFKDWQKYVQIIYLEKGSSREDYDEEE